MEFYSNTFKKFFLILLTFFLGINLINLQAMDEQGVSATASPNVSPIASPTANPFAEEELDNLGLADISTEYFEEEAIEPSNATTGTNPSHSKGSRESSLDISGDSNTSGESIPSREINTSFGTLNDSDLVIPNRKKDALPTHILFSCATSGSEENISSSESESSDSATQKTLTQIVPLAKLDNFLFFSTEHLQESQQLCQANSDKQIIFINVEHIKRPTYKIKDDKIKVVGGHIIDLSKCTNNTLTLDCPMIHNSLTDKSKLKALKLETQPSIEKFTLTNKLSNLPIGYGKWKCKRPNICEKASSVFLLPEDRVYNLIALCTKACLNRSNVTSEKLTITSKQIGSQKNKTLFLCKVKELGAEDRYSKEFCKSVRIVLLFQNLGNNLIIKTAFPLYFNCKIRESARSILDEHYGLRIGKNAFEQLFTKLSAFTKERVRKKITLKTRELNSATENYRKKYIAICEETNCKIILKAFKDYSKVVLSPIYYFSDNGDINIIQEDLDFPGSVTKVRIDKNSFEELLMAYIRKNT